MSGHSAIEWTQWTWNPVVGCTRVTDGCDHCLDPETLVLYADFTWRRLGGVKNGDILVGFDEYVQNDSGRGMRMLRPSTVTAVWRTRQPAMKVTTDKAEVIRSGDHRFFSYDSRRWVHATNFTLGSRIRSIGCRPGSRDSDNYAAGYLMGMTDGDGTWRFTPGQRSDKKGYPQCYWRVALTDEDALCAIQQYLLRFGLQAQIRPFTANTGHGYRKTMQRIELRAIPHLAILDEVLNYQSDSDFGRGYLAGLFDAEGSFHRANLRISNKNRSYLDRAVSYGIMLALDFRIGPKRPNELMNARLYGPRRDRLAFFTLTRPAIQRKVQPLFDASLDADPATVEKLEFLGERELIDIETSTHTFYANGLATHNCYAFALHDRRHALYAANGGLWRPGGEPMPRQYALPFSTVQLLPERLEQPLRVRQPRLVFVNSVSDLFHSQVPDDYIRQVFDVMRRAHWHTFQVLTKRAGRLRRLGTLLDWPPNVWMGVSIENDALTVRADALRAVPAAVRFLSCEPLLGPLPSLDLSGIHWVIAGAESGKDARLMNEDWVGDLRDKCFSSNVPFFLKQYAVNGKKINLPELGGKVWNQFPLGGGCN